MQVSDYYAGMLRHLSTVQEEPSESIPDGTGGRTPDWTDVFTDYGNVAPLSGREGVFAAQLQAVTSHRVLYRWRPGIDAGMRIVFGSRVFNIRAAINVEERDRWLVLFCDEGVAT